MNYKIVAAVPTKNEETIIGKTLETLSKLCAKIVILDDDSTDNTFDICKSFDKVDFISGNSDNILETGMSGIGKTRLLSRAVDHCPDYILMLDADEIPTPNIMEFFNNIDRSINGFSVRMINLQGDENHYRTDSFVTSHGVNINHNPFSENAWRKTVLMKVDKNISYMYDTGRVIGGVSKYHPLPGNIPNPVINTEDFFIIHYGKISNSYISGEKDIAYAQVESKAGIDSFEKRVDHHRRCRTEGVPIYEKCKSEWFW
jgi:glycosyltransferase involved in cell wall biosynthesis